MDASANLWTDTKEDAGSALYRRKITRHRTQVTHSFWEREGLCFATRQLLLIQGRIVGRGAFYARLIFRFPTV